MVSDASKKKAAQKKTTVAAKREGKTAAAATSSKASAAENGSQVSTLASGVGDFHISDRTCTGVLCSHPQSRDIRGWQKLGRAEDFKDAARRAALNLGYNDSKTAAIMASFIMRKIRELSSFTQDALTTLQSVGALEQFIMKHKKDYVDLHRTTEQERDSIEHGVVFKNCKLPKSRKEN
ncbi:hypothetical protein OROGR_014010 [Orobanche gracilis]